MLGGFFLDVLKNTVEFLLFVLYLVLHRVVNMATFTIRSFNDRNLTYQTSALLQRVLWRNKLFIVDQSLPRDFLTFPISNVHPNYVLKPNVSLYAITTREAVFVETPAGMDIYKSDVNPFLYMSQYRHCHRVVTMPIESMHKLASEMGRLSRDVVWLSNIGRCGSTIIGQLFEDIPATLVISESDAIINLSYLKLEGKLTPEEYERLFISIVKIICKPHPGTKRFCVKPRSCGMIHMGTISKLFPEIKQLFLYRNCLETVASFFDYTYYDGTKRLLRYCNDSDVISWVVPYFRKRLHKYMAFIADRAGKPPSDMNMFETLAAMWASFICLAKEVKLNDQTLVLVKYEDLVSYQLETCKHIFRETRINLSEIENAVARLRMHSQKPGVVFKYLKKKNPWRNMSKENKVKVNVILRNFKMPLLGEDVYL